MRLLCCLPLLLAGCLLACHASPSAAEQAATPTVSNAATPMDNEAATPPTTPGPYRLIGIYDPGLQLVAWAMKVPRTWRVQQSYQREWNGALPSDKVHLRLSAPDNSQQIEYLPFQHYFFSDGPMRQQMLAQAQSMGMALPRQPNELPPLSALAYIRQVLLPQLAQHGLALQRVGNELQSAAKPPAAGQSSESKASVDGVLANGNKVRVEVRLFSHPPMRNGADVLYGWGVIPSIIQTTGDLTATYAHTRVAQESVTNNPEWQRRNQELSNKGLQANQAAREATRRNDAKFAATMQRNHEARMAGIAASGAANTARHNDRMAATDQQMASYQANSASQDRQHEYYVDNAIRGETKYANPTTGERVKLDNTYNHTYTDNQGRYYGSNTSINAGAVNWQELQQVAVRDY